MISYNHLYTLLPQLLHGANISLEIALYAFIIGISGGTLLALLLLYAPKPIRWLGYTYVTIIRGTPMLVQLVTIFYILPTVGIILPAFWCAIIAIGCNSVAYTSQVIQAGIQAVPKGQYEAAQTLGFSWLQTIRYIILPQAFKNIFPALNNECITLIKDSSLASVIGVAELTHEGSLFMSKTYDAISAYMGITLMYLIMTSALSYILNFLEKRLYHVEN